MRKEQKTLWSCAIAFLPGSMFMRYNLRFSKASEINVYIESTIVDSSAQQYNHNGNKYNIQ